jgi:hypothetical protein
MRPYAQWKCKADEECYYKRDYFYGPVFRIAAPKGFELYVFRRVGPLGAQFFYFILFDPVTNRAMEQPRQIRFRGEADVNRQPKPSGSIENH